MTSQMSRVVMAVSALIVGATTTNAQDSLAARFARVDSLLQQQYPSSEPGAVVGIVRNGSSDPCAGCTLASRLDTAD